MGERYRQDGTGPPICDQRALYQKAEPILDFAFDMPETSSYTELLMTGRLGGHEAQMGQSSLRWRVVGATECDPASGGEMLSIVFTAVWLAVVTLFMALCRFAAQADDALTLGVETARETDAATQHRVPAPRRGSAPSLAARWNGREDAPLSASSRLTSTRCAHGRPGAVAPAFVPALADHPPCPRSRAAGNAEPPADVRRRGARR
jgi:hypothetical protein